ncbi:MAG: tetratricopeptide repeat protein [Candidatus Binataceae bacterium]
MTANPPTGKNGSTWASWCLGGVLCFVALVYSRSLEDGFVADDWVQIVHNRYIGDWSFIWKSLTRDLDWYDDPLHLPQGPYYRPLHNVWIALNFHLFGTWPMGWHAEMVALHLIVVWMVYRVAARLSGNRVTGLAAAALFGLMPLSIEAVAVIAAVPEPLCAAFALGAFEFFLRSRAAVPTGESGVKPLAISLALFAGALLSYENAAVFPALVAAYAFIFPSPAHFAGEGNPQKGISTVGVGAKIDSPINSRVGEGAARNAIAAAWPYALVLAAYLTMRLWVLGFIVGPGNGMLTIREAVLTIPSALWNYLWLIAMPWRGAPAHPLYVVRSVGAPGFGLPVLGLAAIGFAAILALRRDPRWRLHLFCAAWFLISLAPMLNLGKLRGRAAVQDRYLYFALFGACALAADIGVEFARRSKSREAAAGIVGAAIALGYAGIIFHAEPIWHDDVTLFTRCAAEIPDWAFFRSSLGLALAGKGNYAGARKEFMEAAEIQPDNASNHYYLAVLDEKLHDRRSAAREMARELELLHNPGPNRYMQLALLRAAAGDRAGAEVALNRAAAMPGGADPAALGRAQIQFIRGDTKDAIAAMRELVQRNPGNEQMLAILGSMLLDSKQNDAALAVFRRVVSIEPNDLSAHYKIALALHQLGRDDEARGECATVLAAAPGDREARALMDAIGGGQ